jgi:hypothetical protein
MKIIPIECPIIVSKFKHHQQLKDSILNSIEESLGEKLIENTHSISKTDWHIDSKIERLYFNLLSESLVEHLKESYGMLGAEGFELHNIWYQQYYQNSSHSWHTHQQAHFTNVYYLELPKNAPKTEILEPIFRNKTILPDVEEGDIISFPAFIHHRSPVIKDNLRKTVISFNTSLL